MRIFCSITICLAALAASAEAQDLPISRRDRAEIRATVAAATREPLQHIFPVYEFTRVPGAIPVRGWSTEGRRDAKDPLTPIITYKRTDQVVVHTGRSDFSGGAVFTVQKLGGRWKIIRKGAWTF